VSLTRVSDQRFMLIASQPLFTYAKSRLTLPLVVKVFVTILLYRFYGGKPSSPFRSSRSMKVFINGTCWRAHNHARGKYRSKT
jgi:hypothetical protein